MELGKLDPELLNTVLASMGAKGIHQGWSGVNFRYGETWYSIENGNLVFPEGAANIA